MRRSLLVAVPLWLVSLIAGAAAIVLADFGAPSWVFVLLLAWLLTLGLPTVCAVLLLARYWPGPSFQTFLVSAALVALVSQWTAVWLVQQGIGRWRTRKAT